MSYRNIRYDVVKWLNDGVCGVRSVKYGEQAFTKGFLRKAATCADCGAPMGKGEQAFRPVTNGYNRMHRVCLDCFMFPETVMGKTLDAAPTSG